MNFLTKDQNDKKNTESEGEPLMSTKTICDTCQSVFPDARVINLKKLSKLEGLSGQDSRNILSAALRYHHTLGLRNDPFCRNFDVTSLDEGGALTTIFAIPKTSSQNLISKWRRAITDLNLANAWNS